jgi:hypothetical protein
MASPDELAEIKTRPLALPMSVPHESNGSGPAFTRVTIDDTVSLWSGAPVRATIPSTLTRGLAPTY